ncbi:lipopolysaccharide biosynthesis protein [Cupriavidus sp. 8B]
MRIVLQFATQIFMARILGPEQYGIFAVGAIVVGFGTFFSDFGLAYGLIQKKEVSDHDVRFAFTWQVILGLLVTLVVIVASPYISSIFNVTEHGRVIAVLSVVCLLNAMTAPANNMLVRELKFKVINFARIISYVGGYIIIGLSMAIAGFGFWALVAAWIAQALIYFALVYMNVRHPIRPKFWHVGANGMFAYGSNVLITNLTNWFVNNIDRVIVGRMFSAKDFGLYSTVYNMIGTLTGTVLSVVNSVFFAASAKVSSEPEKLAAGYRALLGGVFIFGFPAFVGLAVVADTFVSTVYGEQWRGAGELLKPLSLAMPMWAIFALTTPLLWSTGNPRAEFRVQLTFAIMFLATLLLVAKLNIISVAWTVFTLFLLRAIVVLFFASRLLDLQPMLIFRSFRSGLILTAVVGGAVITVDTNSSAFPSGVRLLLDLIIGAVTLYVVLLLRPRLIGDDLRDLLLKISAKLPPFLSPILDGVINKA